MCGIGGIILPENTIEPAWLEALDQALRHRGPDDFGYLGWTNRCAQLGRDAAVAAGSKAALVHRRLSIIDLSELGWQPMVSADGGLAIVFNGEIYNFLELREQLEVLGRRFRSHSDTEVILAAWQQWGPECLPRFTGMFSVALLDLRRGTVVLARDPFGIKPLYLARWRGGVAFASEIPALLALPGMDRRIDPQAAYDFLALGLTDRGSGTLLAGIERLPAGHWLEVSPDGTPGMPVRYWQPTIETADIGEADAAAELRRRFVDSVGLHLRSDVPVGVNLSGGIDSTAILAAVRSLSPGSKVHAFSFIAEDECLSEEKWIDLAAAEYGVELHKTKPTGADLVRDIGELVALQGEPFATTGMFAQMHVFRLARDCGIKVTLDGQGADELFAGYPTYRAARLADLLTGLDGAALRLLRTGGAGDLLRAGGLFLPPVLARLGRTLVGRSEYPAGLAASWFRVRGVRPQPPVLVRRRSCLHDRLEATLFDLSLPALLRYADRNSMAYSVESRVPFLTTDLASFALSLPADLLVDSAGTGKVIFRKAMRGLVTDKILDRRDKVGFAVPEARWLGRAREQLERQVAPVMQGLPMLDWPMLIRRWQRLSAYNRQPDGIVWRSINFALWASHFAASA